jgi:hypothetical protein
MYDVKLVLDVMTSNPMFSLSLAFSLQLSIRGRP